MCRSSLLAPILALAVAGGLSPAAHRAGLKPDPVFQSSIERTVSGIVRQEDAPERIQELRRLGADRRGDLLLQLALYLAASDGTERSMAGALIFHQLGFTADETIEAVLPHMGTADDGLRRALTGMLGTFDRAEDGAPDFGVYTAWLTARGGAPPAALVTYLYDVSPVEAARCMRRVYSPASAGPGGAALDDLAGLLAREDVSRVRPETERSRAREAIEKLARDPAWWNRRCASEILRRHTDLGSPEIRRRLREDPDPLARGPLEE